MAAFKSVYTGSSSSRGTDIRALELFNDAGPLVAVPLIVFGESLRLKAAGSICMIAVLRARRRPKGGREDWHLRLHEEGSKGLNQG